MRFSTKSLYGLQALLDMAYTSGTFPVQIKDISRRQRISQRYLEQIFQALIKAKILGSKRGRLGGYYLARKPGEITVREILEAAEGDILLVDCLDERKGNKNPCKLDSKCVTQTVWREATDRLNEYFSRTTLETLCEKGRAMGMQKEADYRFICHI